MKFAFQSSGITSIGDFFTNANKAVEGGLSRDAAVRAMTLGAAEILGVDNRLGSIEAGKIANLTFVKGDLFGKDKFVPQIIIDGKVFEQKEPPKPPAAAERAPEPDLRPSPQYRRHLQRDHRDSGTVGQFDVQLYADGSALTGTMTTDAGMAELRNGRVTETDSACGERSFRRNVDRHQCFGTVTGNQISGLIDSPQERCRSRN